jgi:hypothetical protein
MWACATTVANIKHQAACELLRKRTQCGVCCPREVSKHSQHFIRTVLHCLINSNFIKFANFRRDVFEIFVARKITTRCGALPCFCDGLVGFVAFFR